MCRSRASRSRPRPRTRGARSSEIRDALRRALNVMRGAVDRGMVGDLYSASGLVGGDAAKLRTGPPGPLADTLFRDVLARALAVQEVNAAMGVIVAAPTAGGAGVLPAVLTGVASARGSGREKLIDALATAGLIGAVVAERASLSGAEGGCQAETGAAAANGRRRHGRDARRHADARSDTRSRSRSRGRSGSSAIRSAGSSNCRAYTATRPVRRSRSPRSKWRSPASPSRSRWTK